MRDLRDVIGFYLYLCEQCNPPRDVLELECFPDEEQDMDAYMRPEMMHQACSLRVTIPPEVAQDEVVALLEDLARRLRDNPTYLDSVREAEEEAAESLQGHDPGPHVH